MRKSPQLFMTVTREVSHSYTVNVFWANHSMIYHVCILYSKEEAVRCLHKPLSQYSHSLCTADEETGPCAAV